MNLKRTLAYSIPVVLVLFATALNSGAESQSGLPENLGAYRTNLPDYGIPDTRGLIPFRTKYLDKSSFIPGRETRLDFYNIDGKMVGVYRLNEPDSKPFAVILDNDWESPLDLTLIDNTGTGYFIPFSMSDPTSVPDWVIRKEK